MQLPELEQSLDALRHWLTVWTLVVVLGLILEYRTPLARIFLLGLKIVLLRSRSFDRCVLKRLLLHSLGAILVTGGVAGELWIEFRASQVENDLRIVSDSATAVLNAKTAEAIKDAGIANARAASNDKEAARLGKIAEDERAARVQLEKLIGWRTITPDQQRAIGSKLSRFSDVPILFTVVSGDDECWAFALQLTETALDAGWSFRGISPFMSLGPLRTGLIVTTTGDQKTIEASEALIRELTKIGLAAKRSREIDRRPTPMIEVSVDLRPIFLPPKIAALLRAGN